MFVFLSLVFCTVLIAVDQFFKYLVVEVVKPVEYIDIIDGVLRFRYVENTGAVFGSFSTHTVLLTVFSIALLIFTIIYLIKNKDNSKLVNFCLLLMVSGGVGNIIDRIRLHYVIDYIEPVFVNFAVFNFADCLITVGAFVLIFYLILDLVKDVKKDKSKNDNDTANDEQVNKKRRFIRKAEVEGDKEAAVFNAVITGEAADDVLNEIELGVDSWKEPEQADVDESINNIQVDSDNEASADEHSSDKDKTSCKISVDSLDDIDLNI